MSTSPAPSPAPPPAGETLDARERARIEHERVVASGEHVFAALRMHDVVVDGADLAIALELDPRCTNPRGGLQGGLVASLADIVAGRAANDVLPEGQVAVTADLHVHYLRSIDRGPAVASARIVRHGRRTIVTQVDITDGIEGPLGAVCTLAWSVLGAG